MDFLQLIEEYHKNKNYVGLLSKINRNANLKEKVEQYLKNLYPTAESISEGIYFLVHNISSPPTCKVCGGSVKYKNLNIGFFKYCSTSCAQLSSETKDKRKKRCLELYGEEHHSKRTSYRLYIKKRNEKNEFGFSSAAYKQYLKENNISNASQLSEVKEKIKNTYNNKSEEEIENIKKKAKETLIQKYGVENAYELAKKFLYHEYILPSGKVIKLQGYEHVALNKLLKQYDENDIVFERKLVPKIKYEYGTLKTFYPDFYIPKDNLIIEVKSKWTFSVKKEQNLIKLKAAAKNYNSFIWICSDTDIIEVISNYTRHAEN